jgi:predicted RNA methylase
MQSKSKAANEYSVYESSTRNEMLPFVPDDARIILDVGCSVGNFGALVKSELKAEVWGVEIDAEAAERAKGRLDKVLCGALVPIWIYQKKHSTALFLMMF